MKNSFGAKSTLTLNNQTYGFFDLSALPNQDALQKLPFSLKILLENLLRFEDDLTVFKHDIENLIHWSASSKTDHEIAFRPARVILQDFTGVPAIVDLASMRYAMKNLGGDPKHINPLSPVDLVIDHSVMVDYYGDSNAFIKNVETEFSRNEERYAFLRWGQTAFENFRVVPPGTGIVHQVNLEYLAQVVFQQTTNGETLIYPDTLIGTDSHTTMINGLGVLGWGVGGIEAEAAMLGQPVTMLLPEVVGFKLSGQLPEGTTATDLVLTVTQMLRRENVVGKFVEFYGDGLDHLPLADRATISNMAPEYGATCGIFPIDDETLKFLRLSGREETHVALVEQYAKQQGLFRTTGCVEANYSQSLTLDLNTVVPSIAGPKRPQDRISLREAKDNFQELVKEKKTPSKPQWVDLDNEKHELNDGSVVIAAITSCTNTSNPDVMIAAGLLAKKALDKGLYAKPWVKTSFAPGSQVVSDYLAKANLMGSLEALGFNLVGYGCTTCIGNSGPLLEPISDCIKEGDLSVAAVLSGNRNFEGRIHPEVRYAYLASPPLVVAYALTGTMNVDFYHDPIGTDQNQKPVYLKDIWPSASEIQEVIRSSLDASMFSTRYQHVFQGDQIWKNLSVPQGEQFEWQQKSTYIKLPPYFDDMDKAPPPNKVSIQNARVLALLGDSVTTDHISPAGSIAKDSPAGRYLREMGVADSDFNSYGSRRGNHEVMMRGTFANVRLRNQLVNGKEGNWTVYLPSKEEMSIFDAAMRYREANQPLIVIAGKEYGTGSSRDWAAKGPRLLGIQAVIAESFERIHRSNLIGMGILPLQFVDNQNAQTLKLTGSETYTIEIDEIQPKGRYPITIKRENGESFTLEVLVRIDTPKEVEYYQHEGILHYVLRQLLGQKAA